ncbi:MAG TPA: outer membrane protein transport protein [Thermodesulfovibrionales bacterium]|nr:outer membrane protein transport protein [Thermodesulfovibrionales bacterium]
MRKLFLLLLVLVMVAVVTPPAMATNGDNLIGIGPISRGMGGVGIAAPQDAISAVFANPAAMCFGPYCPGSEVNFAGTLFMPNVTGSVTTSGQTVNADSDKKVYAIPAIGLSVPITTDWRFGLSAYGVSGLGVDYRNTGLAGTFPAPPFPAGTPLIAGSYTQLQAMKFAPSIAYAVNPNLSFGLNLQIDYSSLDLGSGTSFNYGVGVQLGALYKPLDMLSLGLTYVTPQEVNYKNVLNLGGTVGSLKLASPQQIGLGIAVEPIKDTLLVEVNGKWINWANAKGYDDFDWKDQWVFGIGAQYKPIKPLALRIGYNYANNPVREHSNFVGLTPAGPNMISVQGNNMPTYYYETFRIIGFPAIVKQHITFGAGYEISKRFAVNAGYTHAFKEDISESGTNFAGQPVTLKSSLYEDSLEFGFTWRF